MKTLSSKPSSSSLVKRRHSRFKSSSKVNVPMVQTLRVHNFLATVATHALDLVEFFLLQWSLGPNFGFSLSINTSSSLAGWQVSLERSLCANVSNVFILSWFHRLVPDRYPHGVLVRRAWASLPSLVRAELSRIDIQTSYWERKLPLNRQVIQQSKTVLCLGSSVADITPWGLVHPYSNIKLFIV